MMYGHAPISVRARAVCGLCDFFVGVSLSEEAGRQLA